MHCPNPWSPLASLYLWFCGYKENITKVTLWWRKGTRHWHRWLQGKCPPLLLPALNSPTQLEFQLIWGRSGVLTQSPSLMVLRPWRLNSYQAVSALFQFSSVQLLSHVWLFATPWTTARQASLSITSSRSLLKLMPIESVMPSNHLILCHSLLLPPSIFLSIRVFSNDSALCIKWPKYWSFSFSISPSNEHPGLIAFKMDWLDLLAIQGTLKSLLQHHSSKASIYLFLTAYETPRNTSWVS